MWFTSYPWSYQYVHSEHYNDVARLWPCNAATHYLGLHRQNDLFNPTSINYTHGFGSFTHHEYHSPLLYHLTVNRQHCDAMSPKTDLHTTAYTYSWCFGIAGYTGTIHLPLPSATLHASHANSSNSVDPHKASRSTTASACIHHWQNTHAWVLMVNVCAAFVAWDVDNCTFARLSWFLRVRPTRSTKLSRNQLPPDQLPMDQLPTRSTPIKSTCGEVIWLQVCCVKFKTGFLRNAIKCKFC